MRARNREVNIFNMSLLDILCGALGAFCFMMLVLFPYWKPVGKRAEDFEKQAQQAEAEIASIRAKLRKLGAGDAAELEKSLNRLESQMKQQQGQLRKLQQEAQDNDKQMSQMRMREPMLVAMSWDSPQQDLDLYVRSLATSTSGTTMPPVDPEKRQWQFFSGDIAIDFPRGPSTETWQIRDVPLHSGFEVYYKFRSEDGSAQPARITNAYILNRGKFIRLPRLSLKSPKTAIKVGVFQANSETTPEFTPEPEYAEEFKQLNTETKPADAPKEGNP